MSWACPGSRKWKTPARAVHSRFNEQFTIAAEQKGTALRRTVRSDLDWIFTLQTERVVAKDNTVAIADRSWQIHKTRFRQAGLLKIF